MNKTIISFLTACFLVIPSISALGFSTHSTTITRSFDKEEAVAGGSILVTVSFTNLEVNDLRGFNYTEYIPDGLSVSTENVKIDASDVTNYVLEMGQVGSVYAGYVPFRWILETPFDFSENNPISQNTNLEIAYRVRSSQPGTFNLDEFHWIGYYPTASEGHRAAFGYSEDVDKQAITFTANPDPPVAIFSGNPTSGAAPLTVLFTDASTGEIDSWSWDFGDGGTSTQQNPMHTYNDPGTYTVTLEVTGPVGSNTQIHTNYITATDAQIQYTLTVNIVGEGSVTLEPAGDTYDAGTEVQLTPVPNAGWAFHGWSDDLSGYCNPATLVMNADKTTTATFDVDSDDDGISDAEETDCPNNGDGNSDGIKDSEQLNVASFHSQDGTTYVTLDSGPGTTLAECRAVASSDASGAPSGVTFPYDFFNFTINGVGPGGAATLTLYLPEGTDPTTYWKYGATPADANPHWYEFMYETATETGAEIDGNIITLHFVDGKRGDDVPLQDGMIIDQGGPGVSVSNSNGTSTSSGGGGGCFIGIAAGGMDSILKKYW